MPAWPATLPCQPLAGSLNVTLEPNIAEFKPDLGRPQRSRRYTLTRRPYQFDMAMTRAQLAILIDDFFEDQCVDGVVAFTAPDYAAVPPQPDKTFTWAQPPQVAQIAPDRFRVQMSWVRED